MGGGTHFLIRIPSRRYRKRRREGEKGREREREVRKSQTKCVWMEKYFFLPLNSSECEIEVFFGRKKEEPSVGFAC